VGEDDAMEPKPQTARQMGPLVGEKREKKVMTEV
jgi:hypothetical protein